MENTKFQSRLIKLTLLCIFEGVIAIIALMIIPSDPKNSIFLGYSLERWILVGGLVIFLAIISSLLFIKKTIYWNNIVAKLFMSKWISVFFLLVLFLVFVVVLIIKENAARLFRLCPMLVYLSLVSFQVIAYQLITFRRIEQFGEALIIWFDKKNIILWLTLLISIPLLFTNAIKYKYPLGFAGLYTLMAEGILGANFHLPVSVSLYGPGGIPFAYPPFGLYIMAVFLKMGVPVWTYLRFAPPIFSLLALVPLYLLAKRVSNSKIGGMIAALLAAGSFHLYYMQAESGGIVRGLAFGLGLFSVYFFDRAIESFKVA